jgi:hypothetical protein
MKKATRPPYSPDFAPSDFDLFGDVKHCLAGASFADAGELREAVAMILTGIEKTTPDAVFSSRRSDFKDISPRAGSTQRRLTKSLWGK